jgi:hypothetical protein
MATVAVVETVMITETLRCRVLACIPILQINCGNRMRYSRQRALKERGPLSVDGNTVIAIPHWCQTLDTALGQG